MDNKAVNNNGHEYVDLGLPSGRLWATCNVGASTPTEYGDYFMWGSTKPNNETTCHSEYMPFTNNSKNSKLSRLYFERYRNKFCPNDTLALEYDIAHITMGGDWRMPTIVEMQELKDNTTSKWVKNYQDSGVNGSLLTSKTNGNSIFILDAGYRINDSLRRGRYACLWSSSLVSEYHDIAWYLYLCSSGVSWSSDYRYRGFSVRGVI